MWCKLGVFEEKTGFSGQLKAAKERLRQVFHEKVEKVKESRDVQESFSILERFGSKVSRRYRHYCLLKAINNLLGESVFSADELKLHQDQESAYGNFRFGDLSKRSRETWDQKGAGGSREWLVSRWNHLSRSWVEARFGFRCK
jgi:hypothetical protein